jgi:hypothetical protein
LCQFFCCGRKVNFVRIPYSHDHFSKILRTFFVKKLIPYITYVWEDQLFLALYGSTIIQSQSFLKNIENFVWFSKQYLLGFFILEKQLANIPDRGFLFLCNTLLLYSISPYWRTESLTEERIHSLRVGWRNLFSSCAVCCVSFWFWQEKGFGLHMHVLLRVQYSCGGMLVLWLQWEIVFGVLHILSVQYSCAVVSVFGCISSNWSDTFWTYKMY